MLPKLRGKKNEKMDKKGKNPGAITNPEYVLSIIQGYFVGDASLEDRLTKLQWVFRACRTMLFRRPY